MPKLSGFVRNEYGYPISRVVRCYRRDTGALAGYSLSSAETGAWSVYVADSAEHFAVMHDDAGCPDLLWGYVSVASHFTGSDGSTVFKDEKGNALSASGALVSSSQSKFGGGSAYFSGGNKTIKSAAGAGFAGDFTISAWVFPISLSNVFTVFDSRAPRLLNGGAFCIYTSGAIFLEDRHDGSTPGACPASADGVIVIGKWQHVELDRAGSTYYLFVDGVLVAKKSTPVYNLSNPSFVIGGVIDNNASWSANGYINDMVITKGAARHTARFDPPTAPFSVGAEVAAEIKNAQIYDHLVPL